MKNFMKGYWMRMHVILFRFRTAPVCRPNGVEFIYQQYEIAPYAAGIPTCTLPYDSLENLFTVTMKPLIESTTDSLALTYNPIVKR